MASPPASLSIAYSAPSGIVPGGALSFQDIVMALRAARSRIASTQSRVVAAPKQVDEFYSSPQWRALVSDRKFDADYVQAKARAKRGERLILDHIEERRDGGADLDPANTQWLTFSEHQVKTARARARRARGRA